MQLILKTKDTYEVNPAWLNVLISANELREAGIGGACLANIWGCHVDIIRQELMF